MIWNAPQTTVQGAVHAYTQAVLISQGSRIAWAYLATLPSHSAHFAFTKTLKHTP